MISYDDFLKINLKVASIMAVEKIGNSEKLLKLEIDLGGETKHIVAGLGKTYSPEELIGRQVAVVSNLEPREIMGQKSEAMLLAASEKDGWPVILTTEKKVPAGTPIK